MVILFELQASYVGIGKTTFANTLSYPVVDDCIRLVESQDDRWYKGNGIFPTSDPNLESLLKAYLVLENSAATIDQMIQTSSPKCIVSTRSTLISTIQFLTFEPTHQEMESLINFYKRRLEYAGIEKIVIMDFGTSIASNPAWVRQGYERMLKRGRPFELDYFETFEKYQTFFDRAERVKLDIVQRLKSLSMVHYIPMEFNGFNPQDCTNVLEIIKMELDPYWQVKNYGVFKRVIAPILLGVEKGRPFPTWKFACDQHRSTNRHHPEFFKKTDDMLLLDRLEMLCDLIGSCQTSQLKNQYELSIEEAAYVCKTWGNWHIVKNLYNGNYKPPRKAMVARWPVDAFFDERNKLILWVRALMTNSIDMETFTKGLYGFECVHYYIEDLLWHEFCVYYVAKTLFPNNQPLHERCKVHDTDKWDAYMVAAY
ncbi:RING-type domain-containing protein, partial [Caerostris darwini]